MAEGNLNKHPLCVCVRVFMLTNLRICFLSTKLLAVFPPKPTELEHEFKPRNDRLLPFPPKNYTPIGHLVASVGAFFFSPPNSLTFLFEHSRSTSAVQQGIIEKKVKAVLHQAGASWAASW